MLRQLLVERFRLRLRHMTKDVSGYQLDVAPSGSKLQEAPAEASPLIGGGPPSGGLMVGKAVPVSAIVTFLSGRLGRPIQDRTGLSGRYNWELKWTPDENEFRSDGGPVTRGVSDAGPSLITAVREQLGLRLVSTRIAVETLYINHAGEAKGELIPRDRCDSAENQQATDLLRDGLFASTIVVLVSLPTVSQCDRSR